MNELYPTVNGKCACGCGHSLPHVRKKWFSNECRDLAYRYFAVLKGDKAHIRQQLFDRDGGFCRMCGVKSKIWEADHIHPVFMGGGGCDLSNFQTLCIDCHKSKTYYNLSHHKAISSQAASMFFMRFVMAGREQTMLCEKTSNEIHSLL